MAARAVAETGCDQAMPSCQTSVLRVTVSAAIGS